MTKHSTSWTPAADVALKVIVDLFPVLYLDETAKELFALFRGKYSPSQTSKRLRDTLKYSRKVVYEKAAQRNEREIENLIETLKFCIEKPKMAMFVHKSHNDRKAARRKYGWSPIGTQVNYRAPFNMDVRYIFIGVADCFVSMFLPVKLCCIHAKKKRKVDQ